MIARNSIADTVVLGGGVTGLAAGVASRAIVVEASARPGGICRSYYVRPGRDDPMHEPPADGEAYRFEIGGGHWIFGGDNRVLCFLGRFAELHSHMRRSGVFFAERDLTVPYPLQDHLEYLGREHARTAREQMARAGHEDGRTLSQWLEARFGRTLVDLFFGPFHSRYTAGLWTSVAPQDDYKSPGPRIGSGYGRDGRGYNGRFVYPAGGLSALVDGMASACRITCSKRAVAIDPHRREIAFADGTGMRYADLISTLPLNVMLKLTGLAVAAPPDPYTSVLVLNIGAVRGPRCPSYQWVYVPDSSSGFHRVGVYSNVARDFLPASVRTGGDRTALYLERTYAQGQKPSAAAVASYAREACEELARWGFVERVDSLHATWIDVAYTWSWPGSSWRAQAIHVLTAHRIHQLGRYGRWRFQGIAASIREGLETGASPT